jgi:hypothetical protein
VLFAVDLAVVFFAGAFAVFTAFFAVAVVALTALSTAFFAGDFFAVVLPAGDFFADFFVAAGTWASRMCEPTRRRASSTWTAGAVVPLMILATSRREVNDFEQIDVRVAVARTDASLSASRSVRRLLLVLLGILPRCG